MDFSSSSAAAADWISQFEMEDYPHGWPQLEIPSFHSVFEASDGDSSERAAQHAKRNSSSWPSSADLHPFSGSSVISFGSSSAISFGSSSAFHNGQQLPQYDFKPKLEIPVSGDDNDLLAGSGGGSRQRAGGGAPASACSREHVIAERKRREKLTQKFISLSSLLPGLKKLDKASVLGEAVRYLKQLQEQVKALEEQTTHPSVESVVTNSRKRSISTIDQDPNPSSSSSSNDDLDGSSSSDSIPEIEARFSDKDVLINVHCQIKQGMVPRILDEIQKLDLSVVNCNSMPFGKSATVVTVVAKMNDEFSATTMELVSKIRENLQTLACNNLLHKITLNKNV
ncbi:hypothetical protein V2J09_001843 [Rumex salicifolius]